MDPSSQTRWRAVILVGSVYFLVGVASAALANSAPSNQIRITWRLAAWVASAIAFAAHIGYERRQWRSAPRTTAVHTSLAVALGAFGLAVAAAVRAQVAASYGRHLLALVAWPVLCAVPAFVVAWAAGAVLGLVRRTNERRT